MAFALNLYSLEVMIGMKMKMKMKMKMIFREVASYLRTSETQGNIVNTETAYRLSPIDKQILCWSEMKSRLWETQI